MEPTFLVVGAMKCGTTSLCAYLRQHPEVFVPDPKDVGFFSNDDIYERGWDWYLGHFAAARGFKAIGEGTDNYAKQAQFPRSVERIRRHLGSVRVIYITRDPLRQVASAWAHLRMSCGETLPFDEAVFKRSFYVDTCRYLKQVQAYRRFLPAERMHVMFLDDLVTDLEGEMRRVFGFLGVRTDVRIADRRARNVRAEKWGDRRLTRVIKSLSLARAAYAALPRAVRSPLLPLIKSRMPQPPRWDESVRRRFVRELRDETVAFLGSQGKPADFWDSPECRWSEPG